MKVTINGRQYDTANAATIAAHRHSSLDDASGWWATLYRQPRSGRHFLAGEGGSMTIFGGRARIIPLDDDAALAWADRYGANYWAEQAGQR